MIKKGSTSSLYVYMYVMCVCIYVCMYACMFVSKYVCQYVFVCAYMMYISDSLTYSVFLSCRPRRAFGHPSRVTRHPGCDQGHPVWLATRRSGHLQPEHHQAARPTAPGPRGPHMFTGAPLCGRAQAEH